MPIGLASGYDQFEAAVRNNFTFEYLYAYTKNLGGNDVVAFSLAFAEYRSVKASLRHFRIFVAAAETGQVSKAAAILFTSQPVITEAIKALESEIGVKLFERHAKGVSLTTEGTIFLRHARSVLTAATEAMHAPHQVRHDMTGVLKLACTHTVAGYYLPTLLAQFKRKFAGVRVDLLELTRTEIEECLLSGEIELALCLTSPLEHLDQIDTDVLTRSKRRLWLPTGHSLLEQRGVTLKDVESEPYIMLTVDDAEQTTMRYWKAVGLTPNVIFRTTSIEAIRNLVAGNLGVTMLSDMVYRSWSLDNTRLEALTLTDAVPSMNIGLAWKRDSELGRCARAFVDACRGIKMIVE
jgi:DNA-binding transcriptional LysR family regulator